MLALFSEPGPAACFARCQPQAFIIECVSLLIWTRSDDFARLRKPRDYIVTSGVALSSVPGWQIRSDCATRETCMSDALMFFVDGKYFTVQFCRQQRQEAVRDFAAHCSLEVNRLKFKDGRTVCVCGSTSLVMVLVDNSWCGSTSPRRTPSSSSSKLPPDYLAASSVPSSRWFTDSSWLVRRHRDVLPSSDISWVEAIAWTVPVLLFSGHVRSLPWIDTFWSTLPSSPRDVRYSLDSYLPLCSAMLCACCCPGFALCFPDIW